jgi:Zn-finger nucleic acid-binding protein
MMAYELDGVEIDHCVPCCGTWLDGGELEQLTELSGVPSGLLARALDSAVHGAATKRRCPRCSRKLRTLAIGSDPSVELDRCPKGHGLWFDQGELETIVRGHAGDADDGGEVARYFGRLFQHSLASPGSED